jgi:uncharacterized protein
MTSPFRAALITGATSGIGEQLARLLGCEGLQLFLVGRNRERLARLANELAPMTDVHPIFCDLSCPKERDNLIRIIHQEAPDLVINCAGLAYYGNALHYSTQEQLEIAEVNVTALLELTLEAARTLIARGKRGTILNVSSVLSTMTSPGAAVYAASKAFVDRFSEALDFEISPYGVRVLTSGPGQVATEFLQRATGEADAEHPKFAMKPTDSAKKIWQQILRGERVYRFDWRYRWLSRLIRIIPQSFLNRRLYDFFSRRCSRQSILHPSQE